MYIANLEDFQLNETKLQQYLHSIPPYILYPPFCPTFWKPISLNLFTKYQVS
jgi:hypothetical protein